MLPCFVIPLCAPCHRSYDSGQLDLWPYLTITEQLRAIHRVGYGNARRRISGRHWLEKEDTLA